MALKLQETAEPGTKFAIASGSDTLPDATTGVLGGKGIKTNSTADTGVPAGAGEDIVGVLAYDTTNGDYGAVHVMPGVAIPALAGAAFAAGAELMCDSAGRFIPATSTNKIVATAVEAATAANQVRQIRLRTAHDTKA